MFNLDSNLTASSNTPLECQNCSEPDTKPVQPITGSLLSSDKSVYIDWLQGTGHFQDFEQFQQIVESTLSVAEDLVPWSCDTPGFVGIRWEHTVTSIRGAFIAWNPPKDGKAGKYLLSIPGSICSRFDDIGLFWISAGYLKDFGFKATRIDVYIDDYSKSIPYEYFYDAAIQGNYSGCEEIDPRKPIARSNKRTGWTVYCGSKESDKRVRIYDKSAQSNGEIDAYRFEAQFRSAKADEVFKRFCSLPSPGENYDNLQLCTRFLASLVTGAIAFIDRSSADRASRCDVLWWWQDFLDSTSEGMKISIVPPKPTVDSKIRWKFRQCCKSLLLLKRIFGDTFSIFLADIFSAGLERFSSRDYDFITVGKIDFPDGYRKGVYYRNSYV